MSNMHKLPYELVRDYAEQDVNLTLKLWEIFKKKIKEPIHIHGKIKSLEKIFKLETELFPCLVDMRFKGVRVDTEKAKTLGADLNKRKIGIIKGIQKRTGVKVEIWAADSIHKLLIKLNIKDYKITPKSKRPSLSKNYLESHPNIYLRLIARARQYDKLINVFVNGLLKFVHKGRIHAEINQIRSEKGGTVTGRFSMSKPNLQQIPARGKYGNIIRSFFLPEEGQEWGSFDYSQQEPRLVVHYALKNKFYGAEDLATAYRKNPNTDFHAIISKMAKITRTQAKTINLGLFYGMGKAKLQAELGLSTKQEAEELFNKYHDRVPFVRDLMNETSRWASREGEIRTLLGRGCRFDKWEPAQFGMHTPMTWEDAIKKYGENRIRRAFTYKALNKLIQGSAADMTKKSMLDLYKEGIIAHIQIHDELDLSVESKEQANKIIEIMENAVKLAVPNKVDYESGKTWGDIYG